MTGPETDGKVAIVIPWFGRSLKGGAELQAWNLALRLQERGYQIEVITTCCSSFQGDWSTNDLPAGQTVEPEGFSIRRFPVEPRDRKAFDQVCGYLLGLPLDQLKPGVSPISAADERIFSEHLIRSPGLLSYLETDGWRYAAFIFLPYLYGPILDGLPRVASRAFLQPCLHDEAYAYLDCVQRIVFAASKLLWLSEGEFELGQRLFGPSVITKSVVGMAGVEAVLAPAKNPDDIVLPDRFILLLGRKDVGKGTMHAVEAFKAFHARQRSDLHLIVAGPGSAILDYPEHNIIDLGLVSEPMRCWLLRHALALAQPSPNESFSRVIFEAWQCECPVIVRRTCRATATAVRTSLGGWQAETLDEWTERYTAIDQASSEELATTGQRGAAFARETADWSRVMDRYDQVLVPAVRARVIELRLNLSLTVPEPQRIRLIAGLREVASWEVAPGQSIEVDGLEATITEHDRILHLVTNRPATIIPPDPRRLGYRLMRLHVETVQGDAIRLRFSKGWNRSEGEIGTCPRWATGSAEIEVDSSLAPALKRQIHQVLPNLGYGDAIGNHAIWIRDQLKLMGFSSEIFARHIAPAMLHQAYSYESPASLPADAALIYHHSIGTEITSWVCQHPGPKALIYHNITPAHFFETYRPEFAKILQRGREELPRLAPEFPISVGDSQFNANELTEFGFKAPGVLPLCIDPAHWSFPPDEELMDRLQDDRTNILFVGRVVPNKRHEDLIYTFKFWLEDDPTARLFLVGTADISSFYVDCLKELTVRLRVDHAVHFVGQVNDGQLHAYYRCASMFWCFSEHEGFCVPLIEACAFGVPVVARAEGAVPDTLGDAGLLLPTRADPSTTARWIAANIPRERDKMRSRVEYYSADNITCHLSHLISRLLHQSQPGQS